MSNVRLLCWAFFIGVESRRQMSSTVMMKLSSGPKTQFECHANTRAVWKSRKMYSGPHFCHCDENEGGKPSSTRNSEAWGSAILPILVMVPRMSRIHIIWRSEMLRIRRKAMNACFRVVDVWIMTGYSRTREPGYHRYWRRREEDRFRWCLGQD